MGTAGRGCSCSAWVINYERCPVRGERRQVEGPLEGSQRILERWAGEVLDLCESDADREGRAAHRGPAQRAGETPRARSARENAADEARRALGYLGSGEVRLGACHAAAARAWCLLAQRDEPGWAAELDRARAGDCAAPLRRHLTDAWSELGMMCAPLSDLAAQHLERLGTDPRREWASGAGVRELGRLPG